MQPKMTCIDYLFNGLKPEMFFQQMKQIGSGGFGHVFTCSLDNRMYALKKLYTTNQDSNTLDKIQQEIKNLETIRNSNTKPSSIPEFHGHLILKVELFNDSNYCLIFDCFPKTLRDIINKREFLPYHILDSHFKDFLYGMVFLQSIHISHRDLKPGNIMLDDNNSLKIIDYGLAKDLSELKNMGQSTFDPTEESKIALPYEGTPDYMAPEIGTEKYNPFKADVFSFGLIVLEVATMKKIKRQEISIDAFAKKISNQVEKFEQIYIANQPDKSKQKKMKKIKRILRECLCLDVKERPDFLQIFRDSIGATSENKPKIKYHIRVEQMSLEDINFIFENNEKLHEELKIQKELLDQNVVELRQMREENEELKRTLNSKDGSLKETTTDFQECTKRKKILQEQMKILTQEAMISEENRVQLQKEFEELKKELLGKMKIDEELTASKKLIAEQETSLKTYFFILFI